MEADRIDDRPSNPTLGLDRPRSLPVMHRRLLNVLIVVLVGALLSIALAWRCAAIGRGGSLDTLSPANASELWSRYVPHHAPPQSIWADTRIGSGITRVFLSEASPVESDSFQFYMCVVTRAGWPLRCLEGQVHHYAQGSTERSHTVAVWYLPGTAYLPRAWSRQPLPLSPLPIGFLLNTVFYAALAWAAAGLWARIRRRARLDRNECPQCRYRQIPPYSNEPTPCPECGHCYRHTLHTRPRQILRLWMLPLLVPQLLLLFAWFLGLVNWTWLRIQLHYTADLVTLGSVMSVTVAMLWIAAIAYWAYSDRPGRQRRYISAALAAAISVTSYIAGFVVILIAGG